MCWGVCVAELDHEVEGAAKVAFLSRHQVLNTLSFLDQTSDVRRIRIALCGVTDAERDAAVSDLRSHLNRFHKSESGLRSQIA